MMFLEDYMQLIEDMPAEFKDALMSIRELDLSVQNAMDKKAKEIRAFFRDVQKMKPNERDAAFESLMQDCQEILKEADEKVNIAERLEDMVLKSVAQLDREIEKCKEYLEAEHPGIAAAIEERVAQSEPAPLAEVGSKKAEKRRKRSTKDRKKSSISTSTVSSFDEEPAVEPTATTTPITNDNVPENVDNKPADRPDVTATVLPVIAETIYDPTPYCICNQVAYGDMIACDNPQCSQEWFHYSCMKLTAEPEGKWYCPTCVVSLQKK